jgi:hypothetical protein
LRLRFLPNVIRIFWHPMYLDTSDLEIGEIWLDLEGDP